MFNPLKRFFGLFIFLLVIGTAVLFGGTRMGQDARQLRMWFFDVGQGDATLIETPDRTHILIDGGPDGTVLARRLSETLPFWQRSIDLAILSHPQEDHCKGLAEAMERYRVKRLVLPFVSNRSQTYARLLAVAADTQTQVVFAAAGEQMDFSSGVVIHILSPETVPAAGSPPPDDPNAASVVLRLDFGGTSALFTGDMDRTMEEQLLARAENLNVDILKVAHHGSKNASSEAFMRALTPRIAVIQVGKNSYGHPTPETLGRLADIGAKIFRTDTDGTVSLASDGAHIWRVLSGRCPIFCAPQYQALLPS